MHKATVNGKGISLDGFKLKEVVSFKLEGGGLHFTTLTVKLIVDESDWPSIEIGPDDFGDDGCSDSSDIG